MREKKDLNTVNLSNQVGHFLPDINICELESNQTDLTYIVLKRSVSIASYPKSFGLSLEARAYASSINKTPPSAVLTTS